MTDDSRDRRRITCELVGRWRRSSTSLARSRGFDDDDTFGQRIDCRSARVGSEPRAGRATGDRHSRCDRSANARDDLLSRAIGAVEPAAAATGRPGARRAGSVRRPVPGQALGTPPPAGTVLARERRGCVPAGQPGRRPAAPDRHGRRRVAGRLPGRVRHPGEHRAAAAAGVPLGPQRHLPARDGGRRARRAPRPGRPARPRPAVRRGDRRRGRRQARPVRLDARPRRRAAPGRLPHPDDRADPRAHADGRPHGFLLEPVGGDAAGNSGVLRVRDAAGFHPGHPA